MRNNRWGIVLFLAACGAVNYTDRAAFGIAAPLFSQDLHIDPADLGILFSAFSVGYALFNFVGGMAADRFGAKRVFGLSLALWSLFCAALAGAFSFTSMIVLRVLFGAAEGPASSLVNKITSNWFKPSEAAGAVGIGNAGNPLGAAVAGPLVGYLALTYGWRFSFIAFGAVGLVLAAIWALWAKDRPSGQEASAPVLGKAAPRLPLGFYVRQPALLATAFAFFAINYILYFFLSWFPSYLVTARQLSIANMSIVSAIPWILGAGGIVAGGFLTDFAATRMDRLLSRKLMLGGFLGLSSVCVGFAGVVSTVTGAVTLMSLAVLFMYLAAVVPWIVVQDLVEPDCIGSVSGFNHMLANLGGLFGPLITGFIVQWTGSFAAAFVLAGAIGIAAVVGVILGLRPLVPSAVSAGTTEGRLFEKAS
jgi:ACS family hexuronate transporter-like MFS transporter